MKDMVKADVLIEHRNGFPPNEVKAVGDSYSLPQRDFDGLEAQGLLKKHAKAAPKT